MLDVDAIPTNKTDQRLYYLGLARPAPPPPLRARPVQRAPENDPGNVNAQPQPAPAEADIALGAEDEIVEELPEGGQVLQISQIIATASLEGSG